VWFGVTTGSARTIGTALPAGSAFAAKMLRVTAASARSAPYVVTLIENVSLPDNTYELALRVERILVCVRERTPVNPLRNDNTTALGRISIDPTSPLAFQAQVKVVGTLWAIVATEIGDGSCAGFVAEAPASLDTTAAAPTVALPRHLTGPTSAIVGWRRLTFAVAAGPRHQDQSRQVHTHP
jgi:hypothetical protein